MRIEWRTPTVMLALCAVLPMAALGPAYAARSSDIRSTVHNLSSSGPGTIRAAVGVESEVCVFCHTPHGADSSQTPLWNKTLAAKTYTVYTSKSLDAETILNASLDQPLGSSKLCLSCHDGAMALGSVRVLRGVNNPATISVANTTAVTGTMPAGSGTTTGYTKNLGAGTLGQLTGFDLTNDHPISVTYTDTLAARDGEMRVPDVNQNSTIMVGGTHPLFGKRAAGQGANRPVLPLEPTGSSSAGQVQCTTCHDPHIKGDATDITNELNIKFLRRPRFQSVQPTGSYTDGTDIICLACHDKGLQGAGPSYTSWAYSAHANGNATNGAIQQYRSGAGSAAAIRQFPANIPVWKAACLNCHDTHTVTGSRRLLREGNDATPAAALSAGGFKAGGASAIEETCYQCHRDAAGSILASSTSVPNIRSDFLLAYRMPITSADQDAGGVEMHDPGSGRTGFNDGYAGTGTSGSDCSAGVNTRCGADLVESRPLLGTTATNRHVECTDCHNPHRVVKNRLFYGAANLTFNIINPETEGTHIHTDTAMTHTNVASGVLRGSWGVEPTYTDTAAGRSFHAPVSGYTVRRGDPGNKTVTTAMPLTNANMDTEGFVTREYQVCLKCHSSYGYSTPPNLRTASPRGLTPAGTPTAPGVGNALTKYTDQAKEFQSPDNHADNSTAATPVNLGTEAGSADAAFNNNNQRSWHPVMRSTGRTVTKRSMASANGWRAPFNNALGTQTIYCTDCHGSNTAAGTVIPTGTNATTGAGNPWGPHGSTNPFILKGEWNNDSTDATTTLCMRCHDPVSGPTGFMDVSGRGRGNLHNYHQTKMSGGLQCTWCHIAVPHGWKNKMFLVNLNDVGEEAGQGVGSSKEVAMNSESNYFTSPPYYLEAKLKIKAFNRSGAWDWANCGSANKSGTGLTTGLINSTDGNASNSNQNAANFMNSGGSPACGKGAP